MENPLPIRHILLVDDDQDDCELFGEALHDFAPHVKLSCVTQSDKLLDFLHTHNPELVFLDVNMPRKNGFQCLSDIRQHAHYSRLPVVMYSNTGRYEDIERAYKEGCNVFMRKPSTYSGLVQSLKDLLHKQWDTPAAVTSQYFSNGRYHPFS